MKLFRFDAQAEKPITQYGSLNATVSRIVATAERVSIVCIHLGAGGILGDHPAVKNQLFLVVQGEGWVRVEGSDKVRIAAGQAAFWEAREQHESGTETGMVAVVLEGESLDPAGSMQPLAPIEAG